MINSVFLVGRLVSEPEIKNVGDDKHVINISVAVQRNYKNINGEYDVDFIKCIMWNNLANNVSEYCHKGDLVGLRGRLQTNNYEDNDGNKKYSLDVVVDKVSFISSKKSNSSVEALV